MAMRGKIKKKWNKKVGGWVYMSVLTRHGTKS